MALRVKVAVGISGGVDSAVAALLLQRRGYDVIGVTMTLGRADEAASLEAARGVAQRLGVPLRVCDFTQLWQREVIGYVRETYMSARTPNPCVRCNERVKFSALPRWAFETCGCDRFATGHYARTRDGRLFRGKDHAKDQSYFLYRIPKDILSRTEFPLGEMTKAEVRAVAHEAGFEAADRGDSQDFCGGDTQTLLQATDRTGDVIRNDGKVIGAHRGYWRYTIGQRKGLGIGGGTPYYVIGLDAERNEVRVGSKAEASVSSFALGSCVRLASWDADEPLRVKVRSAGEPRGSVTWSGSRCQCPTGLIGVAPGQSAVFYRDEEIVGGGIIQKE